MKFNNINKIILFGGSYIFAEFVRFVVKQEGLELVVFSAGRHLEEEINGKPLKIVLDELEVRYYDAEDINTDEQLKNEITDQTLGIAMGAAWVFEKSVVDMFAKNHFLDFMGIDLPRYRGWAHYTWQILHGSKKGCANLQVILGGKETFHRGPIVKRREYELDDNLKTPKDYFDFIVKEELNFLKVFLQDIKAGKDFELKNLDESESSFYPSLHTKTHGLINWSWTGENIYNFINAFSDPYPGASTFVNGKKVFLKDVELIPEQEKYHPFTSGIVVRQNEQGLFVATVGNLLLLKKVFDEEGKDLVSKIQLGDRLHTPSFALDEALGFKAVYRAKGLQQV
jgi:methionyl-tRNA formyltransferase